MSRDRIVRIAMLAVLFVAGLIAALARLTIVEHDTWLERSYRNRWAFRDVPTRRGEIADRHGVPLAWDVPSFDLELCYQEFRRDHPVAAARHAADLLVAASAADGSFSYEAVQRLPAALELLLAIPVAALRDRQTPWPGADRLGLESARITQDLRFYTASVVAGLLGVSRLRIAAPLAAGLAARERGDLLDVLVDLTTGGSATTRAYFAALLRGAQARDAAELRSALDAALRAAFDERLAELTRLDARLLLRSGGAGPAAAALDDDFSLFALLESRHADWIEWRKIDALPQDERFALTDAEFWRFAYAQGWRWRAAGDWTGWSDDERQSLVAEFLVERERRELARGRELPPAARFAAIGSEPEPLFEALPEDVLRPRFFDEARPRRLRSRVAHEVAVWLSLLQERHPGFALRPSVRRERGALPGHDDLGSLAVLVGRAGAYLPGRSPELDAWRRLAEDEDFARVDDELPSELEEALRRAAARRLRSHYSIFARIGHDGVEAGMDEVLGGSPGLRWVERDQRARETRMFETLDVSPGSDLRLTIDVRLQAIAERAVATVPADPAAVPLGTSAEAALAVIDPVTGDLLALVGRLRRIDDEDHSVEETWTPGAMTPQWHPYVGSVAKPLVALEYLRSGRTAQPDLTWVDPSQFPNCDGRWPPVGTAPDYRGSVLRCGDGVHVHRHGAVAHDTAAAIAQSCNVYFFEAAHRLGLEGLGRAFEAFGWTPSDASGGEGVYQDRVGGLMRYYANGPVMTLPGERWVVSMRGIGYGCRVAPVFVARAYAGIATGSLPRLRITTALPPVGVPLPYGDAELAVVREGLARCVDTGTARRELADFAARLLGDHGLRLSGKTGTAEVRLRDPGLHNAWFAGYVTGAGGARLAFAAVVYRSSEAGGRAAGPIVRNFLAEVAADPALAAEYLRGEPR